MKEIVENIFSMVGQTIFMGTPQFAAVILESLLHSQYQVAAVYTQPDRPMGRSRQVAWSPVKRLAIEHKIPVIQPESLKSTEAVEELAGFKPELIIVAAFGHIISQEVLSLPKSGCVNVHPSLLPQHRGPSPISSALLHGDQLTGVTIMLMDEGMDSGPILAQREVKISLEDTTGSLTQKLAEVGAELLLDALPGWLDGKLKPRAQDESQATYSKLITSKDGKIDWQLPAVELWRQVRALNPWPGCYTWWRGKRLKIHEAVPLNKAGNGEAGSVIALQQPVSVGVVTGKDILGLRQIQLEGKRQMGGEEFVRGQRSFIGSILG
ncbi:MAG: methionyl-tRNA formyltransferase [Dehalococcoidia bacterium]|nr:methionyl-tRNA formyltransferase [Dehalococcoidia bacterium]